VTAVESNAAPLSRVRTKGGFVLPVGPDGKPVLPKVGDSILRGGDVVLDCFAGVALGALDAMRHGLRWVGVEVEPRFVRLGQGCDCPGYTLLDRRHVRKGYRKAAALGLCPRCEAWIVADPRSKLRNSRKAVPTSQGPHHYRGNVEEWQARWGHAPGWGSARLLHGDSRDLAALLAAHAGGAVSSPPYEGIGMQERSPTVEKPPRPGDVRQYSRKAPIREYGPSPANLANLPAGVAPAAGVGSPPYEGGGLRQGKGGDARCLNPGGSCRAGQAYLAGNVYGSAPGQLGAESASTFWDAARVILAQLHAVLRPGAVCAWVVKAFVRKRKLVDFPGQWQALCHETGFETVEVVRALLAKRWKERTLFDGEVERKRSRESFFRRLATRRGSPAIEHETVLFVRRLP
jgi:hypothetical protein